MAKQKMKTVRVRAKREGYYGNRRRREGDVFDAKVPDSTKDKDLGEFLSLERTFKNKDGNTQTYDGWMELVDNKTPAKDVKRDSKARAQVPFASAQKAWSEDADDEDEDDDEEEEDASEESPKTTDSKKATGSKQVI